MDRHASSYTSFPDPADPSINIRRLQKGGVVLSRRAPRSLAATLAGVQYLVADSFSFLSRTVTRCLQADGREEKSFRVHIKLHALEAYYRLGRIPVRLRFSRLEMRVIMRPNSDGPELEGRLMRLWRDIQTTQSLLRKSRDLEPRADLGREVLALETLAQKLSKHLATLWVLCRSQTTVSETSRSKTARLLVAIDERAAGLQRLRTQLWNDIQNPNLPRPPRRELLPNPMRRPRRQSLEQRLGLMEGVVEERDLY